ncbi:MAG: hypothetical protein C5B53_10815 [Candidatus Melainabacteria bacterium]|nr:MAG: hypothetical protein C5B53_10815 [Candidatus Melainabacteria bacterium]
MPKTPCLLVIEDDPRSQMIVELLAQRFGWDVVLKANAAEGLSFFREPKFDCALILVDCRMAEMSGLEFTKSVRKIEAKTGEHIPIIAVTANAMIGDREICLASGMDDYLSKPYTIKQFEAVVKKWLPPSEQANG